MSGRLRVALIAGGRSSEHEISLASARSVLAALDPERYDVVSVAIGRDGRWALGGGRPPPTGAAPPRLARGPPRPPPDGAAAPARRAGVVLAPPHPPAGEAG